MCPENGEGVYLFGVGSRWQASHAGRFSECRKSSRCSDLTRDDAIIQKPQEEVKNDHEYKAGD